ncbi:DUF3122 domain-containing protein [Cyanobium sp. NIES-981]|uniref:DUF3122 domain-containing protein n=1 Tax=Cyanobium sp. NIES-981 TaxID=1851505 RepID=UPI001CEC32EC|nr:DUF3122 domain-containing protein [Cyanobium sp. NIES-981]
MRDRDGQLWGLTLLPVGDAPAREAGAGQDWRLRLTARSAGLRPDHQEPLTLADAQGQVWTLANSSGELVAGASQPLPASAAQFRGKPLRPAPREAWPLELRIPLEDGAGQPLAPARVTLGPEAAAELQRLGRGGP